MSAVVGVDLSTRALDLVKLDESSSQAEWVRCELAGNDAWSRTLGIREAMWAATGDSLHRWLEDVYLVAIEAPYGRGQAGTNAVLNRVVGAVAASLPAHLRSPERCWVVRPDEWKKGLGLKGKPTEDDLYRIADLDTLWTTWPDTSTEADRQNARDAYCLAMFCRDTNAKAVAAELGETA